MKGTYFGLALLLLALALGCSSTVSGESDIVKDVNFQFQDTGGDTLCTPQCVDKDCGADGCGGTCGSCSDGLACLQGTCKECTADCEGKDCGSDGCGGSCGSCSGNSPCEDGVCGACVPDCEDKDCGGDGCDGSCGECGPDQECTFKGECVAGCPALSNCTGIQCGGDGCGGVCGQCPCDGCAEDLLYCGLDGMCASIEAELTCGEVLDCLALCGKDAACQDGCNALLADSEKTKWTDLNDCLETKGYYACWDACPDDAESVEDCPEDAQECFSDKSESCMPFLQICLPSGDLGCKAMWLCILACDGEESCVDMCRADGTLVAQGVWGDFSDCLEDGGYFDCEALEEPELAACQSTAWEACIEFLEECAVGAGTCADIWLCTDSCDGGDDLCYYNCLYYGTIEDQHQFTDVLDCVKEQCGEVPEQECYNTALGGDCNASYTGCLGL
jgi:hypothetical protein